MTKKTSGVLEEAVSAMQSAINEVVPPDAQTHLMAAQRELIIALAITVDYHSNRKARKAQSRAKKSGGRAAKQTPSRNKPKKISLD